MSRQNTARVQSFGNVSITFHLLGNKLAWSDIGIQLTAEHDIQVCKYDTLMKSTGVRGLEVAFVLSTAGMTPDGEQRPAMAVEYGA